MLSNSRTVFICVLFLGAVVVFSLLWNSLRVKKAGIRLLLSVSAACTAALILWWLRDASFVWFDQITGFKSHVSIKTEEDIRELTDLSGRPEVWLGALKIIVHDPKTFFLGVTPLGITPALKTYGGLSGDFAHAHNIVLQVGASMGVPAMIAFTVFIVRITIQCVRAYIESKGLKIKKTFMIPAIIASLLIMNLAEAYLVAYFSVMSCVFYLACGILVYRLKS